MSKINRELALTYCAGEEEIYTEILESYYNQGKKYCENMIEYYKNKDLKNYAIVTHAIKSTSLTIGAEELSALAKEMEFAAKDGNIALIDEKWEFLYASYQEILSEVAAMLRITDTELVLRNINSESITPDVFFSQIKKAIKHIQEFETDEAVEILQKVSNSSCGENIAGKEFAGVKKSLDKVVKLINDFDYDEAEEILSLFI